MIYDTVLGRFHSTEHLINWARLTLHSRDSDSVKTAIKVLHQAAASLFPDRAIFSFEDDVAALPNLAVLRMAIEHFPVKPADDKQPQQAPARLDAYGSMMCLNVN